MITCTDCGDDLGIDDLGECDECGSAMCYECVTRWGSTCSDCQDELAEGN